MQIRRASLRLGTTKGDCYIFTGVVALNASLGLWPLMDSWAIARLLTNLAPDDPALAT
jgi:hypothetical protein